MESRKVLFVITGQNNQKSIESSAETLGQLKQDMRSAGISYDNMSFLEGRTRTELKDDSSLLPTNIPVRSKGTEESVVTNDLVFMLTTANKKIKSGAMSRTEAYAAIKASNLQAKCVEKFGKNFTQCSTTDLISLLEGSKEPQAMQPTKTTKAPKEHKPCRVEEVVEESTTNEGVEEGTGSIEITKIGSNKLAIIKLVKELTGLGLKETKDLVESYPSTISGVPYSAAEKFVSELNALGCKCTIMGSQVEAEITEAPITQTISPTVDCDLRSLLCALLNLLSNEEILEEDYFGLKIKAESLCNGLTIAGNSSTQPKKAVKSVNEDLSRSDIDGLFGSWAK